MFRCPEDCFEDGCDFTRRNDTESLCETHGVVHVCRPDLFFNNTCVFDDEEKCVFSGKTRVKPFNKRDLKDLRPGLYKDLIKEMYNPYNFRKSAMDWVEETRVSLGCEPFSEKLLESNVVRCFYLLHHHRKILEQKRIRPEVLYGIMKSMFNSICYAIVEDKISDQAVKRRLGPAAVKRSKAEKLFMKHLGKIITFDRVYVEERIKTPLWKEDLYILKRRKFLKTVTRNFTRVQ